MARLVLIFHCRNYLPKQTILFPIPIQQQLSYSVNLQVMKQAFKVSNEVKHCIKIMYSTFAPHINVPIVILKLLITFPTAFSIPSGIRSTGWTPLIKICFHNQRSDSVNVYWIDYGGSPVRYNTLGPRQGYCQLTFGTHPWFIATVSGTPLEIVIPYQANMDVSIK